MSPFPCHHRTILWAEHVVADTLWKLQHGFDKPDDLTNAVAQLKILAARRQWWARLYVAEIMRQHHELEDASVMNKLRDDPDEHVRDAARGNIEIAAARAELLICTAEQRVAGADRTV